MGTSESWQKPDADVRMQHVMLREGWVYVLYALSLAVCALFDCRFAKGSWLIDP